MRSTRGRLLGVVALGIASLAAFVPAASAKTHVVRSHAMTPAVGTGVHFARAGVASQPDVTFGCQNNAASIKCYGPSQIRQAYGFAALPEDGAGQTIVIVDAFQSPTIAHDLHLFDAVFGLPDPTLNIIAPDGLTPFDQSDPNQVGWSGEISLDVEWAHAIAPAATIDLVLARSNQDLALADVTRYAIDHHLGNVISQSFGEAESCMDPSIVALQHHLFKKAAAFHMTVFASAGDDGAAQPSCDGSSLILSASTPASDAFVTGVGGTQLNADATTGDYISETVWNEFDTFGAAGGGGFSSLYRTPGYQKGFNSSSHRGVPDISYSGAINGGVLTVWSSSGFGPDLVFIFGGTSAGSPQWAGLTALADQAAGQGLGRINRVLYRLASKSYSTYYNDITVGDNTFPPITGYAATPGWDAASGLGTPKAWALVPALAAARPIGR